MVKTKKSKYKSRWQNEQHIAAFDTQIDTSATQDAVQSCSSQFWEWLRRYASLPWLMKWKGGMNSLFVCCLSVSALTLWGRIVDTAEATLFPFIPPYSHSLSRTCSHVQGVCRSWQFLKSIVFSFLRTGLKWYFKKSLLYTCSLATHRQ